MLTVSKMQDANGDIRKPEVTDNSVAPAPRPASASGAMTGAAGVAVGLLGAVLLRDWAAAPYIKTIAVLALAAAAMIAVDVLFYRVQSNSTTGLATQPIRPLDLLRVSRKLVGFWLTIGVIAFLYALIPEYRNDFYQPFEDAALFVLPGLLIASPFYIAYVDRRQHEPVDAYAQLAMLVGGTRPDNWNVLAIHARGWLVKAFFTPLMFVYVHQGLGDLWKSLTPAVFDFEHIFGWTIDLFYLFDVFLATIAYTLTLRVFDSQIRSVEPTLGGWIICVICYKPLTDAQAPYIQYELDNVYWGVVFAPYPWLYVLWGSIILALVFIYVWSTAAFGLRFSNLTNRGIITNGPYRWVKHPAYLSKNLSWWMISVPFVAGAGWMIAVQSCLMLGVVNLIYYLRAKTEERHLKADPVYREYMAFMARHGLFAHLLSYYRGEEAKTSGPSAL